MKKRIANLNFLTYAALILAVIFFVNPIGDFPLNDDWQYAYPVKTMLEGRMEFQGIFAPNILLQIVWGYLFCLLGGGFDFTFLRVSTIVAALLGLVAFYKICRAAGLPKKTTFFATLALGLTPLFFNLSFSFMSDVPFLSLVLSSLLCFFYFIKKRKIWWLVMASVMAIASYYVRQPGILLLPCFGAFLILEKWKSTQRWLMATGLVAAAAIAYFSMELWVKPALRIDDNYVPVSGLFTEALLANPLGTFMEWIKKAVKTVVYLGFFSLPFFPFLFKKMQRAKVFDRKKTLSIFILNTALLAYLVHIGKVFPFGGNVFFNFGLGPELLADVYTLGLPNTPQLPAWAMLAANFVGQLSASFLGVFLVKKFSDLDKNNCQFVLFLFLLNALYLPLLSITSFFDRYLLLPIAATFFLLAQFIDEKQLRLLSPKWLPFIMVSLFSILGTKDYLTWNRAKLQAFQYLTAQGADIKQMDAGYELNGFFNYFHPRQEIAGRSFWWVTDDKWMITFGPVKGYREIHTIPYWRWLSFREEAIRILERP